MSQAGSLKYMAPEVKNGNRYNSKADIYSAAVVAYEMFKGPNSGWLTLSP